MSDDGVIFIAATQCAVIRGDRFLVIVRADGIKDAPGALVFPGGKVEVEDGPGDVLETAVRREVLEETGHFRFVRLGVCAEPILRTG